MPRPRWKTALALGGGLLGGAIAHPLASGRARPFARALIPAALVLLARLGLGPVDARSWVLTLRALLVLLLLGSIDRMLLGDLPFGSPTNDPQVAPAPAPAPTLDRDPG